MRLPSMLRDDASAAPLFPCYRIIPFMLFTLLSALFSGLDHLALRLVSFSSPLSSLCNVTYTLCSLPCFISRFFFFTAQALSWLNFSSSLTVSTRWPYSSLSSCDLFVLLLYLILSYTPLSCLLFLLISLLSFFSFSLFRSRVLTQLCVGFCAAYRLFRGVFDFSLFSSHSFRRSALPRSSGLALNLLILYLFLPLSPLGAQQQLQPIVYNLYPSFGPTSGGTAVLLTGNSFSITSTYCQFGNSSHLSSPIPGGFISSSSVTCENPPSDLGYVIVEVTSDGGASFSASKTIFLYTGTIQYECICECSQTANMP